MIRTITELWNGNLGPIRYFGKNNSEMKQLETLMQRNLEKLEENLNEKEKEAFKKYNACVDEYMIVSCEQAFCDGFCLGAKIVVEALTGAEQVL